jgi:hypothetical protein
MQTTWSALGQGRWSDYPWTNHARGPCAIDPYIVWADLTKFADLAGSETLEWIPLLLRVKTDVGQFVSEIAAIRSLRSSVRIAPVYGREASPSLAGAKYCVAAVTKEALATLLDREQGIKNWIEQLQLGLPVGDTGSELPDDMRIEAVPDSQPLSPRSKAPVVVGVIDEGFAFAQERFREPGKPRTRIEAFWDQSEGWSAPNPVARRAGSPQQPRRAGAEILTTVPYGMQLLKGEIDALLDDPESAGTVDEDRVYRAAGYRGAERRASHGTHVMDLAAGYGPGDATPEAGPPRIVCVALPRRTTGDTSGLSLGVYVLDALRYILDRADRLVPGARVVVNLSYGHIAGPHDGSSMLEQAIDDLIALRRSTRGAGSLEVVIAAGNNHLSRCHASIRLGAGRPAQTLDWRVLPDDATPSFMEVWPRAGASLEDLRVRLTPPHGKPGEWVQPGKVFALSADDDVLASVVHLATGDRPMILVAVAPTATLDRRRRVAPAGTWRVEIEKRGGGTVEIDAWIQRDDNVHGFRRRGRQSYFDDPGYQRVDADGRPIEQDQEKSYVRRAGTLNAIATGTLPIVVGGYRSSDGAAALYSARGPDAPSGRFTGPDAMAVSERSVTRRGVRAAGTRSGSSIAMNGTSVAAPQVARWIAERMADGKPAGVEELRAQAERDDPARRPVGDRPEPGGRPPALRPDVKPKPEEARGGAGRMRSPQRGEDGPDTFRPFAKR